MLRVSTLRIWSGHSGHGFSWQPGPGGRANTSLMSEIVNRQCWRIEKWNLIIYFKKFKWAVFWTIQRNADFQNFNIATEASGLMMLSVYLDLSESSDSESVLGFKKKVSIFLWFLVCVKCDTQVLSMSIWYLRVEKSFQCLLVSRRILAFKFGPQLSPLPPDPTTRTTSEYRVLIER